MPPARVHSQPKSRFIGPVFALLSLPFTIAKGLYAIAYAAAAMSAIMRQKPRRSYTSDKKDAAAYEKRYSAPTVQVEESCPICQEPMGVPNKEGITERWSILPCGHRFGSYCIKHYLRVVADDRPSCPICRQPAYHTCGHPYLPVILPSTTLRDDNFMKISDTWTETMRSSACAFCRTTRYDGSAWKSKAKRGTLRSAGSWLLTLATHPRRLFRSRDRQPAVLRGPLLIPWQEDDDGNGGPWVDPFPRQRDPLWERWWDNQEPKEA